MVSFKESDGRMDVEKKIAIFGAGFYGKLAFGQMDSDKVMFFLDNNPEKQGTYFCGKPIISPKELPKEGIHVIIAALCQNVMEQDLIRLGITDYSFYLGELHGYFENEELIVNPYEVNKEVKDEEEWNNKLKIGTIREEVNSLTEKLYQNQPLFNHIEIETINRCNGNCSFCPVNKNSDPREYAVMKEELFYNIVDQLAEMQYAGRFTTFSNNEPFLDDRIIEFNRYARKKLPKARIHLYTNGTLLTMDKFIAIVELLDELIIDNYQKDLKLIKPCRDIRDYVEMHPELKKKVTIVLRDPNEILTSRGGNAPNRKDIPDYSNDRCVLPFKQMIIRPTGKVSLCCNDALGKYTLGDVNKESLLEIWNGPRFAMVRKCLYEGRKNWGDCRFCDNFSIG